MERVEKAIFESVHKIGNTIFYKNINFSRIKKIIMFENVTDITKTFIRSYALLNCDDEYICCFTDDDILTVKPHNIFPEHFMLGGEDNG